LRHTDTCAPGSAAPVSRSVTRTCVAVVPAMNFDVPNLGQSLQSVLMLALVPAVKRIMSSVMTRLVAGSRRGSNTVPSSGSSRQFWRVHQ
jgi:hypothetical protein